MINGRSVWGVVFTLCISLSSLAADPSLPQDYLRVPLVRQATDFSCGVASVLSVLAYFQKEDTYEAALYRKLKVDPSIGVEQKPMLKMFRDYGLRPELKDDMTLSDVRAALAQNAPIIIDYQAWPSEPAPGGMPRDWRNTWEEGHYSVIVGMDQEYAYLMDPSVLGSYTYIPIQEFEDRWHNWEPRRLPHGRTREIHVNHSGIIVRGDAPQSQFPAALKRTE